MKGVVALDATILTNFALVNRPDLVYRLWPGIVVATSATIREYQSGIASRQLPEDSWIELPVVELSSEESEFALNLPANLGEGERSCLSIAKAREGTLATDDLAARRQALFASPST
jgi:predicted nucleic acid-binding protein